MRDQELDRLYASYRAKGDVAALGELFDRTAPELWRLGRHLGGSAHAAEDLVQSTFVTAIERSDEFDTEREVLPWLVGILARHAANARRKRERMLDADRVGANSARELSRDASTVAEERELTEGLDRAVRGLEPLYRDVLRAFLIDGKRPLEIAEELGVSPGAIRVRVHRGLGLLRAALPAGFAAGAAVSITSGRGLGAVRGEVMAVAERAVPSLATATAASTAASTLSLKVIGGLLVSQRILLVAAALVAALASYLWIGASKERPNRTVALAVAADEAMPDSDASRASHVVRPESQFGRETVALTTAASDMRFLGRVRDAVRGSPIVGARVSTIPVENGERVVRAESNAAGEVEFHASPAERESLRVDARGYASAVFPTTQDQRDGFWHKLSSTVRETEREVDLGEIRLVPGVEFAGRVIDSRGGPVAGATLVLCASDAQRIEPVEDRAFGHTDLDGRMVFDSLAPRLIGREAAYYVLFALHPRGIGWTRVPSAAERDRVDEIEITLAPGIRLEVRVRDDAGVPLAGAHVRCVPGHAPFSISFLHAWSHGEDAFHAVLARAWSADTDERGVAVIPHLLGSVAKTVWPPECRFVIDVEHAGETVWREHRELGRTGSAVLDVVVARDSVLRISGKVMDERGKPLEGVRVTWPKRERSTTTAADGSYALPMKPDDVLLFELEAASAGYGEAPLTVDRTDADFRYEGHDFVLRRPLSIAGSIVDDIGRPVSGVLVRGLGPERRVADTAQPSDEQGRFVIDDACIGEWELNVYPPRDLFVSNVGKRWMVRGGDRYAEIVLERKSQAKTSLEIDVVDAETGEPVDVLRATILAAGRASLLSASYAHWSRGRVRFDEVDSGRYDVWVAVVGRPDGIATIDVDANVSPNLGRIEIGRPGRVAGRVDCSRIERPANLSTADCMRIQDSTDLVVSATVATVTGAVPGEPEYLQGAAHFAMAKVGADGSFALSDLMPGLWRFELRGERVRCAKTEVRVASNASTEVHLVAERAGVIELVPNAAVPTAWVVVQVAYDDRRWLVPKSFPRANATPAPMRITVDPGKLRWRAMFTEAPNATRPDSLWQMQEGEVEIQPGEQVTIPVAVVRIEK